MLKKFLFTCAFAALAVNIGHALDHSTSKIIIPVGRTSPADGKQMFSNYCAPCHGVDGRGNGPVASALKAPPTDLAALARTNGGKFPVTHLVSVLRFGIEHPSHGSNEMPVWGPILARMNQVSEVEREQRTTNLVEYVRTLQAK
jgi:mono/diheme cytochrome c family protein